jgi:hypothetical protein
MNYQGKEEKTFFALSFAGPFILAKQTRIKINKRGCSAASKFLPCVTVLAQLEHDET